MPEARGLSGGSGAALKLCANCWSLVSWSSSSPETSDYRASQKRKLSERRHLLPVLFASLSVLDANCWKSVTSFPNRQRAPSAALRRALCTSERKSTRGEPLTPVPPDTQHT